MTPDTTIQVGSKEWTNLNIITSDSLIETFSMNSSMAHLKCEYSEVSDSTQNPDAVNNTSYYCIDFNSMPASDLRNINDIIYDFTTSNTSGSHGNRGRLCVNTDHQHNLPFTNRVIFCDDQTKVCCIEM